MESVSKTFYILAAVFLFLGLFFNFLSTKGFPRIPGDIYIDRPGIKVYIPVTSAIIISVILTLILNYLRK